MILPSISIHEYFEYIALNIRYHHAERLFLDEDTKWRDLCFRCNSISPCQYINNEFKTPLDCITFNIYQFYCRDGMQHALSEWNQCKDEANTVFEKFKYDPQKEHPHLGCAYWHYYDGFVKQLNLKPLTLTEIKLFDQFVNKIKNGSTETTRGKSNKH